MIDRMIKTIAEDLMLKDARDTVVEGYTDEGRGVEDIEKRYKKMTKYKKTNDFSEEIGRTCANIELLINVLALKKFQDNREDMLYMINVLEQEVDYLRVIAKEVEVE